MEEKLIQIIKETEYELLNYPKRNLKYNLKNAAKRILKRGYKIKDLIDWPNGLIALSLVDVLEKNDEESELTQEIESVIDQYYCKWMSDGGKVAVLDDAISGLAFLRMGMLNENKKGSLDYAKAADIILEYIKANGTDKYGSLIYRPKQNNGYILADMLGMAVPFLAEMEEYELAYIQLSNFIDYGMDNRTGLPYHGYTSTNDKKLGLIGWGRAVGWMLMGEAAFLNCVNESDFDGDKINKIKEHYDNLSQLIMSYQREDGLFGWNVMSLEGYGDTSATAMILNSVDSAKYSGNIKLGKEAIFSRAADGKIGGALSECIDFGVHPQVYGSYPWSQGPGLSLLIR